MGRQKTEFHNRDKVLQKTSVQHQVKSKSAKKPNRNKKELEEMDSLIFLKDSKDKKEVNGLDEKIKLLKSELKMLLGNSKLENSHYKHVSGCETGLVSQDVLVHKYSQKKAESEIEAVEKFNLKAKQPEKPLPTKFSDWLDKTIDEMTVKSQNQNEFSHCNDLLLNSSPQKGSTTERFSEFSSKFKLSNMSSLPQYKVEKLLYQSFYLQNFEIYLSSSDENDQDHKESSKAIKRQRKKTRKSYKSNKEKFHQSNLNSYYRSSPRVRKKRTIASSKKNSSKKNLDLLHNSALDNSNVMGEKNIEYVELDVTNYDWSEPFEIDDEKGNFSDVEILENPTEKGTDINEEIKISTSGPVECDLNTTYNSSDKIGKDRLKMGWECPICFEQSKGQEVVATQCGHVFCKKCLESHMLKFSKSCPTCRTDLSSKPPITLFNF